MTIDKKYSKEYKLKLLKLQAKLEHYSDYWHSKYLEKFNKGGKNQDFSFEVRMINKCQKFNSRINVILFTYFRDTD